MAEKGRYWCGVCYPENMIPTWKDDIGDTLQLPGEYAVHDKCFEKDGKTPRKEHAHIIIAYNNTTTQKNVISILNKLSKPGCVCCSTAEVIHDIKHMHNYIIHDTADCKKKKKHLYDKSARITFNNFDLGAYEQLGVKEKNDMAKELCDEIIKKRFTNFADFYSHVVSNFDSNYFEILKTYSGLFERLTKANFQKKQEKIMSKHYQNDTCDT